jgi:hypothetical protein
VHRTPSDRVKPRMIGESFAPVMSFGSTWMF